MRRDVPVAHPGASLFEARQRMLAAQVGALPVVEGARYLGMLTSRDIGEVYQLLSINLVRR